MIRIRLIHDSGRLVRDPVVIQRGHQAGQYREVGFAPVNCRGRDDCEGTVQ